MSPKPAVLLISPGILKWTDMDFGLPHLVSMGGYLREHTGVRVEILDLNYEGGDHHDLQRTIEGLGPFLVIGLSLYSSFDYMRVMALARFLKDKFPAVPMVAGGYHASAMPTDVVFEQSPFDAVIRGEGERPMLEIVTGLLGGGGLEKVEYGPDVVPVLDELPYYAWDLLDRYWPRAQTIGRKLQIYLSRGCPYHCTFCMERSKSGYSWRAYSPERAIEELRRLAARTDLSHWVVNLADPLFGFRRSWRREVLEGIIANDLLPRQYWTLTRSDDLDDVDVDLLARARFSIGIGMESGSPRMLGIMQKGNQPERYLDALRRLARLSRLHGLNWAANIIVGHPGENLASMRETHTMVSELFTSASETCGWVSIDPFRLYPGAHVHEAIDAYSERFGSVFHNPTWWKSWYDGAFHAQHIDPSHDLSYEDRVRFMVDAYGPLIGEVQSRFRGQGRSIDRVYRRSIEEQRKLLSPAHRDLLIRRGKRAEASCSTVERISSLSFPLGLHVKDPWVRKRENGVRRLLDQGVLRTQALVEALLQVAPERFMPAADAEAMLADRQPETAEGLAPVSLPLRTLAAGLEALEPALGDAIVDATAASGHLAAVLSHLVGERGRVVALHPCRVTTPMVRALAAYGNVEVRPGDPSSLLQAPERWDGLWVGAAMPRFPSQLRQVLRDPDGRAIAFLGPRFRPQDLVSLTRRGDTLGERRVGRVTVPVLGGRFGWLPERRAVVGDARGEVRCARWPAPALAFHVLTWLDLGPDAASLYDPDRPARSWAPALRAAWEAAPGRLDLHALALQHHDLGSLVAALEAPPPSLSDAAGRTLCATFVDGLEAEAPSFLRRFHDDAERGSALLEASHAAIRGPLARLRSQLWSQSGGPPSLLVLDVPALGAGGRGGWRGSTRVVATSLDLDPMDALMQILHEEVHPVTDPVVRSEHDGWATRSTRAGSDGFALHTELERVAILATGALIDARAPELAPAFERWTARWSA